MSSQETMPIVLAPNYTKPDVQVNRQAMRSEETLPVLLAPYFLNGVHQGTHDL